MAYSIIGTDIEGFRREFDDIMKGRMSLPRRVLHYLGGFFGGGVSLGVRGSDAERRARLEALVGREDDARNVISRKFGIARDVNQDARAYGELQDMMYRVKQGEYPVDRLESVYGRFCALYDAMVDIQKASSARVLLKSVYEPSEGAGKGVRPSGAAVPDRERQEAAYRRFVRNEGRREARDKGVKF